MEHVDVYKNIASRTNGDIYIGVVGTARTGKSTFIAKFLEQLVLPNISSIEDKKRIVDEMPQAGSGTTITTTEPKFCPSTPATIEVAGVKANIRLCDCAGYIVEGCNFVGGEERKISTMWDSEPLSFEKACTLGTRKVAKEHSTVCVLVATDGSVLDIPRENYVEQELRLVEELKEANKPFVVLLNTKSPKSAKTKALASELKTKYGARVIAKDIIKMESEEVTEILQELSKEFKTNKIQIEIPNWMKALDKNSDVISKIFTKLEQKLDMEKIGDMDISSNLLDGCDVAIGDLKKDLATGEVSIKLTARDGLFFEVLSKECEVEVTDEFTLIEMIKELKSAKDEYEKLKFALDEVEKTGYGVVSPTTAQLELFEPELLKEGNQYGVRLSAKAPSLHIMRVDVETQLRPIVGTDAQGEELAKNMLKDFEQNKQGIWDTNMFGKPLSELVLEGLNQKISQMPNEVRAKMKRTVSRIVNEGKGGVICILL